MQSLVATGTCLELKTGFVCKALLLSWALWLSSQFLPECVRIYVCGWVVKSCLRLTCYPKCQLSTVCKQPVPALLEKHNDVVKRGGTYESVTWHIWSLDITHMNKSSYTYEQVIIDIPTWFGAKSRHANQGAISLGVISLRAVPEMRHGINCCNTLGNSKTNAFVGTHLFAWFQFGKVGLTKPDIWCSAMKEMEAWGRTQPLSQV